MWNSQLKSLLWEGNLLSLDRSYYSMHSIHFKENSTVAPDLSLPVQEGSAQHRAGRMEKVRPLSGSPACYNCLWVACLLGCLNRCFNKCCCNVRICDLVNTWCTSEFWHSTPSCSISNWWTMQILSSPTPLCKIFLGWCTLVKDDVSLVVTDWTSSF